MWYKLILTTLAILLIESSKPSDLRSQKYICQDGTPIPFNQICDGIPDCPDTSDETKKLCYQTICPADHFRCSYGACIEYKLQCDGMHHCIDGSDERVCNESPNCLISEFECISGECIASEKVCDRTLHCRDGSDETICDEIPCDGNGFHCRSGECIPFEQRCNSRKDCIDGSDESKILCDNLRCEGTKLRQSTTCPAIESERIIANCYKPQSRIVESCNKPQPIGTIAFYQCKSNFSPANNKQVVNIKTVCQDDGAWNREILKCTPDCGKATSDAVPLILYGDRVHSGTIPWHAVLYTENNQIWLFICGGTLITEKTILTAAHCTWNLNPQQIKVGLAKYLTDFTTIEEHSEIHGVVTIIRQPSYQDSRGNYGSDLAILVLDEPIKLTEYIQPICLDWQLKNVNRHLTSGSKGFITGMGLTENDHFSPNLQSTYLPVISNDECIRSEKRDFKKYITYTTFCAGYKNGSGVCNGDSGGGLMFTNDEHKWVLQGIVSISPRRKGTGYCDPKYYTIFTKVSIYLHWIYDILKVIHGNDMVEPFLN